MARSIPSTEADAERPSTSELIDALNAPGPLIDQPAVQALLRDREQRLEHSHRPQLRLIKGGMA